MTSDIYIYGDISQDSFIENDVTQDKFRDSIYACKGAEEVRIHINSTGGSVLSGCGIINIIDKFSSVTGATISVYIDGVAAGIASAIAMAGDKICMAKNASFMLCNSFSYVIDENEIEKQRKMLNHFDGVLAGIYMRRFDGTRRELRQLMKNDTWLDAEEAMKYGFVDEIIAIPVKHPKGASHES